MAPSEVSQIQVRKYEQLMQKCKHVKSDLVLVTPEKARALLRSMGKNRKPSPRSLLAYVEEILTGAWQVTNQAIGIDVNDRLIDGQQRLWAVILSKIPVPMLIVRGLPPSAMEAIDAGRVRKPSENRELFHGEQDARFVSHYTSIVANLIVGTHVVMRTVSAQEGWRVFAADGIEWAIKTFKGDHVLRTERAAIAGSLAFAYRTNPEAIDRLGRGLRTGAGLSPSSVVLQLRDFLASPKMRQNEGYRGDNGRMILARIVLNTAAFVVQGNRKRFKIHDGSSGVTYFRKVYEKDPKVKAKIARWRFLIENFAPKIEDLEREFGVTQKPAKAAQA